MPVVRCVTGDERPCEYDGDSMFRLGDDAPLGTNVRRGKIGAL
jgi:hypothetical protein